MMQKVHLGVIFSIIAIGVIGISALTFSTAYESQTFSLTTGDTLVISDSVGNDQTPIGKGGITLGGWFIIEHYDKDRNLISREVIHNRLLDTGETFFIEQTFKEGTAGETVDADQIGAICVTAEVAFVDTSETLTVSTFDTNDNLTETNCISDTAVSVSASVATIGPETFSAGTHVANGDTITGIGICQGSGTTPSNQCADQQAASSGILFAVVNISDVTLAASETVDITYNFDISSPSD